MGPTCIVSMSQRAAKERETAQERRVIVTLFRNTVAAQALCGRRQQMRGRGVGIRIKVSQFPIPKICTESAAKAKETSATSSQAKEGSCTAVLS